MNIYTGTSGNDSITPDGLSAGVKANPAGTVPSTGIDTIYGEAGNDDLNGGGGADKIYGGDGDDWVGVFLRTDELPEFVKFTGTATFHGGNGNDTLFSTFTGFGNNVDLSAATVHFYGDQGDDRLSATYNFYGAQNGHYGAATDLLYGGAGNDTYVLQESGDRVIEKPGEGYDTVYGYNDDYVLAPNAEKLVLGYIDFDRGFSGTGNGLDNVIVGTDWNDKLNGGAGNDTIYAVDKPETTFSYGGDTIHGGEGNDTIYGQGLTTYPGEDEINDTLYGDAGNDELFGLYGNDLMYGGAGNDKMWGQSENDTMFGGDGDDRMGGGSGEDRIYGQAGNDVISGTAGGDWLGGGPGNDRFDYDSATDSLPGLTGFDTILDFFGAGKVGGDVIDVSTIDANSGIGGNQAFTFGGTGPGHLWVSESGTADSHISADIGGASGPELDILVKGVTADEWTAGDFIL